MKHYKPKTVPEHVTKVLEYETCDSCGERLPGDTLTYSNREEDEITIERTKGEYWPDGANAYKWDFACCAACWESKVLPIFALKGSEPEDISW